MRFRTLVASLVILGFLGWAGYNIIAAGSSYLAVSGVVDRAYEEAAQRRRALELQAPRSSKEFAGAVRAAIFSGARQRGLEMEEAGVVVSDDPDGLRVSVRWSYPVFTYPGWTTVSVPLSVDRLFQIP